MEKIKRCKFWCNLRDVSERVSGKRSSLNLSIFCGCVEKFQLSFHLVKFSVKLYFCKISGLNFSFYLILIDFSVKLSFIRIVVCNFSLHLI